MSNSLSWFIIQDEVEERVVPDKWEEEAEEEEEREAAEAEKSSSDERLGDKPDARTDEE